MYAMRIRAQCLYTLLVFVVCVPLLPGPEKGVGGIDQKVRQVEHLEEAQKEAAVGQQDGEPSGH